MNKNEYKGYRPMNQGILIKIKKRGGKVMLTQEAEMQSIKDLFFEVMAVADDVKDIEPGDGVYFPQDLRKDLAVPVAEINNNGDINQELMFFQIPYRTIMGVKKGMYKLVKEKLKNA